jgi:hypothetical protein
VAQKLVLKCMGCKGERRSRRYLCEDCWWLLRPWVRTALTRKDDKAMMRLRQLTNQIQESRPLEDIEVTP